MQLQLTAFVPRPAAAQPWWLCQVVGRIDFCKPNLAAMSGSSMVNHSCSVAADADVLAITVFDYSYVCKQYIDVLIACFQPTVWQVRILVVQRHTHCYGGV